VKYAFIKVHQGEFSISRQCEVLGVSRGGYYDWLKRPESDHRREDRRLGDKVAQAHENSRQTYGARRIKAELVAQGECISRERAVRLMKEKGLESRCRKKFKATTDSNHNQPVAANVLNREFKVTTPDSVYAGDITYIWTDEGWLYLAVMIDLFSRMVVGWSMASRMTAALVNDALMMAVEARHPAKGLIAHSDRGSQYASDLYQATLSDYGMVCSMSRKGNCWDNSPSESFFHTLKTEQVYHRKYRTREEARQDIFEYIEVFYNRQRRHSTINYHSPFEYELEYQKAA
jgi:transposase InsO family protein